MRAVLPSKAGYNFTVNRFIIMSDSEPWKANGWIYNVEEEQYFEEGVAGKEAGCGHLITFSIFKDTP